MPKLTPPKVREWALAFTPVVGLVVVLWWAFTKTPISIEGVMLVGAMLGLTNLVWWATTKGVRDDDDRDGGGGAAGGGMIKPKIDINVEVMQIKKMLAKVIDAMGIPVPASDMVATPEDLTAMAQGQGSAAGAGGGASSIPPISPIQGASVGGAGGGGGHRLRRPPELSTQERAARNPA
jgi:hypothetical protein